MENLFNKKFVHFLWEDELKGKEGFFAHDINSLKGRVNNGEAEYIGRVRFGDMVFPFNKDCNRGDYRFFYYDPNYECKKAYAEGKQIEYELEDGKWYDLNDGNKPNWDSDYNFRIKPEEPKSRRMNYRELAEWLAKGNGQYKGESNCKYTELQYLCADDLEVSTLYKIRRWDSSEWIEPTYDVYEKDCKTSAT